MRVGLTHRSLEVKVGYKLYSNPEIRVIFTLLHFIVSCSECFKVWCIFSLNTLYQRQILLLLISVLLEFLQQSFHEKRARRGQCHPSFSIQAKNRQFFFALWCKPITALHILLYRARSARQNCWMEKVESKTYECVGRDNSAPAIRPPTQGRAMINKNKTKQITCYTELCCDSYVHGVIYLSDIFEVTGFSCFINFNNFLLVFFLFTLVSVAFFESTIKICQCGLLNRKLRILSSTRATWHVVGYIHAPTPVPF